jgi:inner membrane protein
VASLGHIAVGMAAARVYPQRTPRPRPTLAAVLFWAALSFLPDADVVGFGFGIRYEDAWGHRGATHSLAFAAMLGALIGLLAPRVGRPAVRTGVMATLVLASHPLLDTLTDGGLGCALFWPFDLTRYFAPWTPLPVSPIGFGYFSPYGMYVAAAESVLFAPLVAYALGRRDGTVTAASPIPIALGFAGWLIGLWLLFGSDPVRDRVVRVALGDDTQFTARFSESSLDGVAEGASEADVRQLLGPPFRAFPAGGSPPVTCWLYSRSPDNGYYRARAVCFTNGRVEIVVRRWLKGPD